MKIVEILTSETFIGYLGIVMEAIFLFFVWLEFKYIRKEQQEKCDKKADMQLVELCQFFLHVFWDKVFVDTRQLQVLQKRYDGILASLEESGCPVKGEFDLEAGKNETKKRLETNPYDYKAIKWSTYISMLENLKKDIDIESLKWHQEMKDKQKYDNNVLSYLFKEYQNRSNCKKVSEPEKKTIKIIYKNFIDAPGMCSAYYVLDTEKFLNEVWQRIDKYSLNPRQAKYAKLDYKILEKIYNNLFYSHFK